MKLKPLGTNAKMTLVLSSVLLSLAGAYALLPAPADSPIPVEARLEYVNAARMVDNLTAAFQASLSVQQLGLQQQKAKWEQTLEQKKQDLQKRYCAKGYVIRFKPFDEFMEPYCAKGS